MEKLELVKYLFSLNADEWEKFDLYLQSPYFTRKKLPLLLFRFLKTYSDRIVDRSQPLPKISRAAAYEQLYPGEPYRGQRLRRVSMELKGLLINFIALEGKHFLPQELEKEYAVRKHLLDRGELDLYADRMKFGNEHSLPQPYHALHHFGSMILGRLQNEYFIHSGQPSDSLAEVIEGLDQYYLVSRLELGTSMINKERIYQKPHKYTFSEEIQSMVLSPEGQNWAMVQLWWHVWLLQQPGQGDRAMDFLDRYFLKEGMEIPKGQMRQIRGFMMNYLNWSMEEGEEKYLRLWWLLRDMLIEGTLYAEGKINTALFRASIRSACLAGEWKWASNFIRDHGVNLKGREVSEHLKLFQALVEFYAGNPGKALMATQAIRFKTVRNEIYLKVLQVMCAFEIGEEMEFFRRAEAFRKYVARGEDLGEKFAVRNARFVRLILRIGKSRFHQQSPLASLKQDIMGENVAEKYWLSRMYEKYIPGTTSGHPHDGGSRFI